MSIVGAGVFVAEGGGLADGAPAMAAAPVGAGEVGPVPARPITNTSPTIAASTPASAAQNQGLVSRRPWPAGGEIVGASGIVGRGVIVVPVASGAGVSVASSAIVLCACGAD